MGFFTCASSAAHEGRPIYIKLQELSPTQVSLQWKIPPVMEDHLAPSITLSGGLCSNPNQQQPQTLPARLSGKVLYECSGQRTERQVNITFPGANPALSSLLILEDIEGNQSQQFVAPDVFVLHPYNDKTLTEVALQYVVSGAEHILIGYDHLLFILCLIYIAGSFRQLLITVTGFTIAHSITLVVSSMQLVWVPIVFIEVLIALSILVLAAEIARKNPDTLTKRYPVALASFFGLLHGFGFASVLSDYGLPQSLHFTALAFFNLGVEIGQVIFIAVVLVAAKLVMMAIPPVRRHQGAVNTVLITGIGLMASYWFMERAAGLIS
ncbi:HupE/UreJ family protein [Flexibacterium corallicola]|uniref:HupE/UreJ family protein n=1 Tax=Flexibacterium corallicola TaxID=3037259 RepID=UPI00286F4D35|nr:HupE/UreJ family protein [Pseudovibrio sp. M1P-2-3]